MGAASEFFSHLYTVTVVFFTLLLLEIVNLVRSIAGIKRNNEKRVVTSSQYFKLVEEKNPTLRFSEMLRSDSAECSVCLSEFVGGEKVRRLQCNHTFHKDCLDQWLKSHFAICPLCRTEVLPYDVVASSDRFRDLDEYDGSEEELVFFLSAFHGNRLF